LSNVDVEGIKNLGIIVLAMPCQIEFFVPELVFFLSSLIIIYWIS
jgi:hypothetical protein